MTITDYEHFREWLDREDIVIARVCTRDDDDNRLEFFYEDLSTDEVKTLLENYHDPGEPWKFFI